MRALSCALVLTLLLAGCGGASRPEVTRPDLAGLSTAIARLPQNANVLGDKAAKWTFGIYAQPASESVAVRVMPQLPAFIRAKVASGEANVKFRATGPTAASRVLVAAGLQGRFWPALVAFESDRRRDARAVLAAAGVADVDAGIAATAEPRVANSIARNGRIAVTAGARRGADVFVVTDRAGHLVDISDQVLGGRLTSAFSAAQRRIRSR